ncbi:RNA binding protein [Rhodotorula toruloides]|uniref:RNA binding protein n=1 Tax=Rhodotorula toruloides TaxID=5286 RepID=A0A2T0A2D0_RHOTO|nr:RNA binding protein [Rhodotorula toruloides]PRQ72151.1 RNA binding protein [Rhodotorula toruloides]
MSHSSPAAILVPATPAQQHLLCASTAWVPPPPTATRRQGNKIAPVPAEQHFITASDIQQWRGEHPTEPLRPPTVDTATRPPAGEGAALDKATLKNYRPPQHPASHVLHTIPPRAPSRSSRSSILAYALHLATSSRLSSYSSPSGSRQLLHLAELERDTQDGIDIDDEWIDGEEKTKGLYKVGANLLHAHMREGGLPPSVERRVALGGFAEEALLSPAAERAVTKIDSESVQPSGELDELIALKPLTTPDTTMLYHSTSATAMGGDETGRPRVNSVAQSLIDLKFGGQAESAGPSSPSLFDDKNPLDGDAEASTSSAGGPATTPHMDYRIVLSQSMRSRARSIFSTSPLPSLPASYCRRHRVRSCAVCAALVAASSERESNHAQMRRKNIPGSGLRMQFVPSGAGARVGGAATGAGTKKPLVQLVPDFLKLSAALFRDVRERANRPYEAGSSVDKDEAKMEEALWASVVKTEEKSASTSPAMKAGASLKGKERAVEAEGAGAGAKEDKSATTTAVEMQVTAEWYDLLTMMLVQACLEGYLVDGWTGTEGVETLFGVGCGVWEGRGWSTNAPVASTPAMGGTRQLKREKQRTSPVFSVPSLDGEESSSDEEDDEEEEELERVRVREEEARVLVEAARLLFGSRDVAQADYERGMRDRTHEFLNVPQNKNLHEHLEALSVKYPLSQFEDALVDFLEAGVRLLGRPALAQYDPSAASSRPPTSNASASTTQSASHVTEPDPYALVRYFAPASFATVPSLASPALFVRGQRDTSPASGAKVEEDRGVKRRRTD